MDPTMMAAIVSGGGKVADLVMQILQGQAAAEREKLNLQRARGEQKQALALAQEGQGDVFGNRLVYKPGIGWTYELSPRTQQITAGEQINQLQLQDLARQGGEDYQRFRNQYLYGPRETQEGLIDENTRLLQIARKEAMDEGRNKLTRIALRSLQGGQIPRISKAFADLEGDSLVKSILEGRRLGRSEYQQGENFRQGQFNTDANRFLELARGTPTTQYATNLNNMAMNARTGLQNAFNTGTNSLSRAFSTTPNQPNLDISGVADSIAKIILASKGTGDNETTRPKNPARLYPSGGVEY